MVRVVLMLIAIAIAIAGCGRRHFDDRIDGSSESAGCVTAFTAYGDQVCAIRSDKTLVCWGAGTRGQLGDGSLTPRLAPGPAQITDVQAVASGEDTVCATRGDGSLWCWGAGDEQQIGDGGGVDRSLPVLIPLADRVIEAASSQHHTCARLANGMSWCWGSNAFGQLGVGAPATAPTPVLVDAIAGSRVLALGDNVTCVIRADESLACWGRGSEGELGDGTLVSRATSAPVLIPDPVAQVSGGCHRHWCAVTHVGEVWCWGENLAGEIGTGATSVAESVPVRVGGLPPVVEVAVGVSHSCARTGSGEIWCWGDNTYGQLGDSTFGSRPTPARSSFVGTAIGLQAGCGATLVLGDDARLVSWGEYALLGTGETVDRATPAEVPVPCP